MSIRPSQHNGETNWILIGKKKSYLDQSWMCYLVSWFVLFGDYVDGGRDHGCGVVECRGDGGGHDGCVADGGSSGDCHGTVVVVVLVWWW